MIRQISEGQTDLDDTAIRICLDAGHPKFVDPGRTGLAQGTVLSPQRTWEMGVGDGTGCFGRPSREVPCFSTRHTPKKDARVKMSYDVDVRRLLFFERDRMTVSW